MARAADAPVQTLDAYVALALAHNPALASASWRAQAAREHAGAAGARPDPMVMGGYFVETPETRVGPQEWGVTLSQRLPFFGKLGAESGAAAHSADAAAQDVRERRLDVVFEVTRWYHEYYRLSEVRRVLAEERDLLERMQDVAQVRYASGRVGQQDVLKAQLAFSQVEDEIELVARGLVTARARLNELIGRHADAPLAEPVRAVPDAAAVEARFALASPDTALARRPELFAAASRVAGAREAARGARRSYYPDLTLGVQYVNVSPGGMPGTPDAGKDIVQVVAGINLPLWFGKLGARVRQADAQVAREQSERRATELRVRSEIEDAVEKVRTARERLTLYEGVMLPQAEQTFAASEVAYQTGTVGFLDYLDSERMLLSVRKRYYQVVADLGVQIAYMDRALGREPR
ncbi:MAG: TolC family protein [Candidatus Krumholzibacteria bacterium]|nr:TolC family protein [Candidatus Krumholzibacteria bacterium]